MRNWRYFRNSPYRKPGRSSWLSSLVRVPQRPSNTDYFFFLKKSIIKLSLNSPRNGVGAPNVAGRYL